MTHRGWSHVSLGTLDMDRTLDFYENVLGFRAVRCDIIKVKEGGQIRHVFFDVGGGQLLAFMEPRDIPRMAAEYDTGINGALRVPEGVYHFAFEAGSVEGLHARRAELLARGVKVTPVTDHDWAQSIYFRDPNGLLLEYCAYTRELNEDDARMQPRFEMSVEESRLLDFRDR
jgi:catechol 2,3-dioxygenase-like lactoylglutathione lyase family enzyme